jgi:virginiamycin A acetyltransferase
MRRLTKALANGVALLTAAPFALACHLLQRISVSDSPFHDFSQFLSLFPGLPGDYLRRGFYYWTLAHCSLRVKISFGTLIAHPQTEIHDGAYIGPNCIIGTAIIGPHATLGSGVHLLSGKSQHSFENLHVPIQEQGGRFEKITIGENCWVGNASVIMADVGQNSIVGAGSVVTSPVACEAIAAGNPAKVLRMRSIRATGDR